MHVVELKEKNRSIEWKLCLYDSTGNLFMYQICIKDLNASKLIFQEPIYM